MAYDYAGSWSTYSGYSSNVFPSESDANATPFSTNTAVDAYKAAGISADKILLGIPLYGRAFTGTTGPGLPFGGVGEGSWEQGVWDFNALPRKNARECWDNEAKASYSLDEGERVMISYDSKQAVQWKANWIRQQGLGGAMWWESSGDKKGNESLISAVRTETLQIRL